MKEGAVEVDDDLWIAIKSRWANLTHNWDTNRVYHASLSERTEGFTEIWGDPDVLTHQDGNDNLLWEEASNLHNSLDSFANRPPPPLKTQHSVTLIQHRPAWEEQLALRIAGTSFVVINTSYAVWEAIGPLPCLRVCSKESNAPPVLVGRTTTTTAMSSSSSESSKSSCECKNSIVQYLQDHHLSSGDWNHELVSTGSNNTNVSDDQTQSRMAQLLLHLIEDTLEPCLVVLQYDEVARQQLYYQQSLKGSNGRKWQVWSERLHALRQLDRSQRSWTTEEAVRKARNAYELLEQQLQTLPSNQHYIMGTEHPVLVDIVLWGNLARALSNVHLVVVLADCPALCRFAQHIWDTYFDCVDDAPNNDWLLWNLEENARNAFCQLPLLAEDDSTASGDKDGKHTFHHALELMNRLSLQRRDLHEVLQLAQHARNEQDQHYRPSRRPFFTFHRWRMGDTYYPSSSNRSSASASHRDHRRTSYTTSERQEEQAKREYQRHDELWIATVLAVTGASLLLFGMAG